MGKTKRLRKSKPLHEMFEFFLDMEADRENDAFALKYVK